MGSPEGPRGELRNLPWTLWLTEAKRIINFVYAGMLAAQKKKDNPPEAKGSIKAKPSKLGMGQRPTKGRGAPPRKPTPIL